MGDLGMVKAELTIVLQVVVGIISLLLLWSIGIWWIKERHS